MLAEGDHKCMHSDVCILGNNIIWVQPAGVVATCKFVLMMHFDERVKCLGLMQIVVS